MRCFPLTKQKLFSSPTRPRLLATSALVALVSAFARPTYGQNRTGWGTDPSSPLYLGVPTQPNAPKQAPAAAPALSGGAKTPDASTDDDTGVDANADDVDPEPTGSIPCAKAPAGVGASLLQARYLGRDVTDGFGPAINLAGTCPNNVSGNLPTQLNSMLKAKIKVHPPPRLLKPDGNPVTDDDWVAVDLVARTLFGEVGGSKNCTGLSGHEYAQAVGRVMLNRLDCVNQGLSDCNSFSVEDSPVKNPLARIAIEPNQFQVWRPKNVKRNTWLVCPASEIQTTHYTKTGAAKESVGENAFLVWQDLVSVAVEMIFHEDQFRCQTDSVKALFYTRNNETPGKGSVQESASINKVRINNPKCVQLWNRPQVKFQPRTSNCAKPKKARPPSVAQYSPRD